MWQFLVLMQLLVFSNFIYSSALGYSVKGADYGEVGAIAYTTSPSSFDRQQFLDPLFLPFLENVKGMTILDAGCGPAHWSVHAAQHGAKVYAIDTNEKMIQAAAMKICQMGLVSNVSLEVGDVATLPYRSDMFDRAISINVAPNLPSSSIVPHFREMFRVLKNDGEAIISIPTSLDIIFTNGIEDEATVFKHINDVLNRLGDNPKNTDIYSHLMELNEVINATFILKNGKLQLVTDNKQLLKGQEIWRKLPVLVVPNYYHPEDEYLEALKQTGFEIEKIEYPHFKNKDDYLKYNVIANKTTRLGPAYIDHAAYALYHVKKKINALALGQLFIKW